MTINPTIDPKLIASMASKLDCQIDQNDPLASSSTSVDRPEDPDLSEASLVEGDSVNVNTPPEANIQDLLKGGQFKSVQSWANSSIKRFALAIVALGSLATILTAYANSKKGESPVTLTPETSPVEDDSKADLMAKKVQAAQKAQSDAQVLGALGDQASSLTDSKDKKLDTDPKTDTKPSTPLQKEPATLTTPPSTPKTDTKPPLIASAPKPVPPVLPLPPVKPIQIPSTKKGLISTAKQEAPVTLANLGNQASSKPSIISSGKTETAKTTVKLEKPNPVPLATLAMADLGNKAKGSTPQKSNKTIKEVVTSLGNRQPETVDSKRSQPTEAPPTPINPQDLGSVGSSGNVSSAGSAIQTAPPPPLLASNIGTPPNPVDQSVNRAWGVTEAPPPQQPTANGLQSVNNSAASQVSDRTGGIYTPPPLADYFRDTAGASTPTAVNASVQSPAPEKTTQDISPQLPLKIAFNPNGKATPSLQTARLPEVPPAIKEAKADSPSDDSKAPIAVAQNQANRLFSVGNTAKAVTLMPIIYGNKLQNVIPKYEIALTEGMIDKVSQVGFPIGTRLIVTPNGAASDIGEIQLDVVSIKLPNNQEFSPPAGAIVVRAENGGLLIGEDYFNRGAQIGGQNIKRVVLGGLATLGSNANRPNVSISTIFGGAGSVTTNNAEPNFWLSILEGAAKEGLAIATEENQAAIKEALAAPKVFKLPKNLKVQVYTNSTIVF